MAPASQPRHRRPSWRQSRVSHRTYLETDFTRKQVSAPDLHIDGDTFFYNPAFLAEWAMPANLSARLPLELIGEVEDWQASGAAVCTALTRIDKLEAEALYRGFPTRKNAHLSRTTSCASPSLPASPLPNIGSPLATLQMDFNDSSTNDVFTPPFTPQDSIVADALFEVTPVTAVRDKADLERLNDRLSRLRRRPSADVFSHGTPSPSMSPSPRRESVASATSTETSFDEAAWDIYIKSYQAELEHLRSESLVRFRHMGHAVNKHWVEVKSDDSSAMLSNAIQDFVTWWDQMTEKAQEYEKECQSLEVPELESVKQARVARGLSI